MSDPLKTRTRTLTCTLISHARFPLPLLLPLLLPHPHPPTNTQPRGSETRLCVRLKAPWHPCAAAYKEHLVSAVVHALCLSAAGLAHCLIHCLAHAVQSFIRSLIVFTDSLFSIFLSPTRHHRSLTHIHLSLAHSHLSITRSTPARSLIPTRTHAVMTQALMPVPQSYGRPSSQHAPEHK